MSTAQQPAPDLLSINEAAARGILRVRRPWWANSFDHFQIDLVDGRPGPWLHLWAPYNLELSGRDPVDIFWGFGPLAIDARAREYVAYTGPLPDSEEYRAEVARMGRFDRGK